MIRYYWIVQAQFRYVFEHVEPIQPVSQNTFRKDHTVMPLYSPTTNLTVRTKHQTICHVQLNAKKK